MLGTDEMTGDDNAAKLGAPVEWTGNLNDDCTAAWEGLTLRAERMRRVSWWWAVYDDSGEVACSVELGVHVPNGKKARAAAERAAREWLLTRCEPARREGSDDR